jgi:hypothetical protein
MGALRQALRRWDPIRTGAAALAITWVLLLVGYVVGVATAKPTIEGLVAAASALAIAVIGLLYAWRLGAGGIVE